MKTDIVNAVFGYFETLYDLNRNLITMCGVDVIDNSGLYEKYVKDIIQAIPRLVPYAFDKKQGKYIIVDRDGLLEYSDELQWLKEGYEAILNEHIAFLTNVKEIRNKYEHKLHGARLVTSGSGSVCLFDMTYELGEKEVKLTATEFVSLVKILNLLFSRLQHEIQQFAYEKEIDDSIYIRRLTRYSFSDFNSIYDSDLLRNIGKALFPF